MKKNKIVSFLLLLFCFSLISKSESIYRDNALKYIGIEELTQYNLYNKKENPSCNLKINFFYPLIYVDKKIQEELQTYFITSFFGQEYSDLIPKKAVEKYTKDYIEEYKQHFEKSGIYKAEQERAKEKGEDIKDYSSFYLFEKTMRNTIMFNRGNIISQVVNIYEYTGGAHGASSTKGLVYDITTGKNILYDEIFYDNTTEAVSALLLSHLMEERRYPNEDALIESGFNSAQIPPSQNFVVNEKGMTFIYNPYELGAYVLGIVEIFVPYSDLVIYMKPESSLFRWGETYIRGNKVKYETSVLNKDYFAYDINQFPGFVADIQFSFPNAYYDQSVLNKLQERFVMNAFGEEYKSVKAKEVVNTFYEKTLTQYENYILSEDTRKFIEKELKEANKKDTVASFMTLGKEYIQRNIFYYNQNNLISYEVNIYSYDGGAHGLEVSSGYTVDIISARNLLYNDIFQLNTKDNVTTILLNKLLKESNYQSVDQLVYEGYIIKEITPKDNFYIDDEGITFIYTPYEIGPYSLGTTKIKLLYTEISNYLNTDFSKIFLK